MARRIKSLGDLQRLMAWTLNQLLSDKIKESKATKIGYLVNIQRGIIIDADLEKRIEALEKKDERKNQ